MLRHFAKNLSRVSFYRYYCRIPYNNQTTYVNCQAFLIFGYNNKDFQNQNIITIVISGKTCQPKNYFDSTSCSGL